MQNVRLFRILSELNYLLCMRVLGMWKGVQLAQHFFRRIVAALLQSCIVFKVSGYYCS